VRWETDRPGPRRLTDGLASVARSLGAPAPEALAVVFARWAEVVGPSLAGRCRPHAVRSGSLVVVVDEPGMATEVRFLGSAILARAAALAGAPVAERVEVRVRPPR